MCFSDERDEVGYGRNPPQADWPGGARLAVNFVINMRKARSRPSFAVMIDRGSL
jgi:hypothetical protein